MTWKAPLGGTLLIGFALAHSVWPQRVSLDWPSTSLLLTGVLLLFSRKVMALLPYIKKLKLGEVEIEIQEKLRDLAATVNQLEESPLKRPHASASVGRLTDTSVEATILDLATKDKSAALVRLAIEIEKEMALRCKELGIELPRPTWRESVDALSREKVLAPQMARALIEFRDIRNQVIHSGLRGAVQGHLIDRALDNGLQLLRLLKATAG